MNNHKSGDSLHILVVKKRREESGFGGKRKSKLQLGEYPHKLGIINKRIESWSNMGTLHNHGIYDINFSLEKSL